MFERIFRKLSVPDAKADLSAQIARADELRQSGDRAQAIAAYEAIHDVDASRIYPLYWLATLCQEDGDLESAAEFAARGIALDPSQVGLLLRAAEIAGTRQDFVTALECYERARALDPSIPVIDALIGDQLCHAGRVDEGIEAFRRALATTPDDVAMQQNLLFVCNFSDAISPADLSAEHRAWGLRHETELAGERDRLRTQSVSRKRPRIGYVSPDLRNHAVSYFMGGVFEQHRSSGVDFVVFDLSPKPADEVTQYLRQYVSEWHLVAGRSIAEIAATIHEKDIDILVDLAGHTNHNRLLVFACKPAPIQVSWLGYLQTTGLASMDYRLTDASMDPPGLTEQWYTEELVRLPVQACFRPRDHTPDVTPLRKEPTPGIRFGSVNNWSKTSSAARRVWAAILHECPDAELVVLVRGGQHAAVRDAIRDQFVREGACASQIVVEPTTSARDFLRWVGTIDVVLDPFPYGGGTTTMHCLYMGVPVLTLAGQTAMARNSIGPLRAVGLEDLIAESQDDYRARAIRLGRNRKRLTELRATLRAKMEVSALMDAPTFARSLESAYDRMWRRYCERCAAQGNRNHK
jgi:predicted O-linked N-acetylglucosamine transferase (SPINDLY family)